LAFSGLAFADIPVTFFFLAAVLCFKGLRQKKEWGWSFAVGALTGMAITSKFSAAILAPVFLLMEFWEGWPRDPKERWPFLEELAGRWAVGLAGAAAWIFLLYSPGMFAIPGHRSPFLYFWDGFWGIASLSGYSTYFLGHLTRTNHLFYFPLALLVKTPPALLVFTLISPFLLAFKRIKIPLELWLPPLAFFFSVMPFANIGIREILPVFPFLILLAARSADSVFRWGTHRFISRAAVIGLVALQVIIVSLEFPKHLSYFNPLLNSNQKLYLLGDSNLDVGQDGKRLAAAAALHNWHHVKLAYFGATDPSVYGMDWSYWTENDLKGPQPGWVYAINAYYLQIGPAFMPDARNVLDSWIAHTPETTKVGDTWYCYEIPGQPAPDSSPFLPSAPPFKYFESLGRETSPVKTQ
jgi:4-amino-4-deoxy-L-arabinose transferase-like glycosyltransferase